MIYVSGGVINSYSTKFPYRISANISHVLFTWNTLVTTRKVTFYFIFLYSNLSKQIFSVFI